MRRPLAGAIALTAMTIVGSTVALAGQGAGQSELAAVRQATARYHDVAVALADAYIPVSPCVQEPGLGAMGIHYLNPGLAGDLTVEAIRPEILLYAPVGNDGDLRLVGVEYWAIALANTEAGPRPWFDDDPPALGFFNPAPTVLGQTLHGPMAGHDPSMPWHYDLHVWTWQANPVGMFAEFNPKLRCLAA